MTEGSSNIHVIVGNRPEKKNLSKIQRTPCRKTVRRDNRGQLALYFPNIAVYNHRSIWKKIKSFCTEFKELEMGAAFHSEVWEKKESKKHKFKIDEMLELEGISYVSTPRPNRRGGGSAITCDESKFYLKEINLPNPDNLEVTFAALRPKAVESPQFVIILCAVYSPPRSRKKAKLVDFISNTYNYLKSTKFPSAYFSLGGDINDLNPELLINISPKFRQIVTLPTRGKKTLSVIITDLGEYYQCPEILPPLQPDVLGRGKPSDHNTPYARTFLDRSKPRTQNFTLKSVRSYPESGIIEFGKWIQSENFISVELAPTSSDKVSALENLISGKIEDIFPIVEKKFYINDKEFMNKKMRLIRRQKSREYSKHKKSDKFKNFRRNFFN